MAESPRRLVSTTATVVSFRPSQSPFRGRAITLSDDPAVGRIEVDGTFLFPLPGVRANFELEPVARGKRQPFFRSLSIAYRDEFDSRFALDTLHTIAEWGGASLQEPTVTDALFGLADVHRDSIVNAIVDGTIEVGGSLREQLETGLYRLRQGLTVADFLKQEFRFDDPACIEIVNALSTHGDSSLPLLDRLRENPYMLAGMRDVHLPWKTLDMMATRFGLAPDCDHRIDGRIVHSFAARERSGHTAVDVPILLATLERDLLLSPTRLRRFVHAAIERGSLHAVELEHGATAVTTPIFYSEEEEITQHFSRLSRATPLTQRTDSLVRRVEESCPDEDQRDAVIGLLTNPVSIVNGGPGSGKSFVLGTAARIALELGVKMPLVLGPTGRAALRTKQVLPDEIQPQTIHRALLADGVGFRRDSSNPIDASYVMEDEAGMLSNPLLLGLLRALPTVPFNVFGDVDQLPPIERGEPFRALIDSGKIPVYTLRSGRRYNPDARAAIIAVADACKNQDSTAFLNLLEDPAIRPYVTLVHPSTPDDEGIVDTIIAGIRGGLRNGKALDDFQIISPLGHTQAHPLATKHLHEAVAEYFIGDDAPSLRLPNGKTLREGERVMQSKNNYDLNLMNGDIAIVERIAGRRIELRTLDTGSLVTLTPFDCTSLIGGFAGTPHKLQGGGFKTVAIPFTFNEKALIGSRGLFSAMTRATSRIVLIGTAQTVEAAVMYEDYPPRVTTLESTLRREMPTIRPQVHQPEIQFV